MSKYKITYCSNIFKNNTIKNLIKNIQVYTKNINKLTSLCFSKNLATELKKNQNLNKIKTFLKRKKCIVAFINGFVYKNFHKKNIKEFIYYPDWTNCKRLIYTKDLIYISQKFLIFEKCINISTNPISYNEWVYKNKKYILVKSINNIFIILKLIIKIKQFKKLDININIEPEPFCLLSSIKDFIIFYTDYLRPILTKKIKNNLKFKKKTALFYINKHLNLCLDLCHASVVYDDQIKLLKILLKKKIKIGRVQVSSALKIKKFNKEIIKTLNFLNKSPFLHQSYMIIKEKIIKKKDFKNVSLNDLFKAEEVRIHCHVPIYIKEFSKDIYTTNFDIINTINFLKYYFKKIKIFEIETYTYNIIYKNNNKIKSIIKEYTWLKNLLEKM